MKKSIKHIIGLPIALLVHLLFTKYNLMGWNEFRYNDEYFGWEFETPLILGQSIVVLFLGYWINMAFEYYQQRKLEEKPSSRDTRIDCIVFAVSAYLGYLIASGILIFV